MTQNDLKWSNLTLNDLIYLKWVSRNKTNKWKKERKKKKQRKTDKKERQTGSDTDRSTDRKAETVSQR